MFRTMRKWAMWCGLAAASFGQMSASAGVVVEGSAIGIEKVQRLSYLAEKNRFTLNGGKVWRAPVSREEMLEIVKALRLDDRLGVAATAQNEMVIFGGITRASTVAARLRNADDFLRAVIFADRARLQNVALPASYSPQRAPQSDRRETMYLRLDDFRYRLVDGVYWPDKMQSDVMLIPLMAEPDAAGNPVPDYDALERGEIPVESANNVAHIMSNQEQYFLLTDLQGAVKIGETAAFIRHLRDSGISLEMLSRYLAGGSDFSLATDEQNSPRIAQAEAENEIFVPITQKLPAIKDEVSVAANGEAAELDRQQFAAESIKQILAQDNRYGQLNSVKMNRETVNDGSYVAFRQEYLHRVSAIDLTKSPEEFQRAYAEHADAWKKTLTWLGKQKISDNPEAFDKFKAAHAPYREELNLTYRKCREIADRYAQ